jgi:hypothetical protein
MDQDDGLRAAAAFFVINLRAIDVKKVAGRFWRGRLALSSNQRGEKSAEQDKQSYANISSCVVPDAHESLPDREQVEVNEP